MLKKLINYQRLLLNSLQPIDMTGKNPFQIFTPFIIVFAITFGFISIFSGATGFSISSNSLFTILFPIVIVWLVNSLLNGNHKLFETIPVSRKYIVLNMFLLSIFLTLFAFFLNIILGVIILAILYLWLHKNNLPLDPISIAPLTKGDTLMLLILVIILFAGTAITFIKNKKFRIASFTILVAIIYGFLMFLKSLMPISFTLDKLDFIRSFSIMPQANIILICVGTFTIMTCIISILAGYKLYTLKTIIKK